MKKIMLAMMATVGLAFFAKADGTKYPGSTDFEGAEFVVGNVLPDTDYGSGTEPAAFWANYVPAESESKIVAGGPNGSTKYASLDTGNQVLLRQADPGYTKDFGSIYFDTMVQFTASEGDSAVSTTDGDKLVIWLQSNEASEGTPASTNLMIRAAKLNTIDYHTTGSQDYTVVSATPFKAGKWYRLTVKTYADISGLQGVSCPGFEVYIDGTKVSVTGADLYKGYFASLVDWNSVGAGELTGIGFQGTGAVDNIAMTSEDPIPPEATYTLTLEGADFANEVTLDGDAVEDITNISEDLAVSKKSVEVVVNVGVDDGTFTAQSENENVTISTPVRSTKKVEEEGAEVTYYFYTFTVTVEPKAEAEYTIALAFETSGGEEVPTEGEVPAGGGSATVQAADADAAVEAVTVQGVNGTVYEASQKYYTKTAVATETAGVFEVTVTLNETELDKDVDAAVEAALEAVEAGATSVALPAGFYYKVESGSALPIATTATGVSTGATIEVKDLTEAAGFFKVSVGTTEFTE